MLINLRLANEWRILWRHPLVWLALAGVGGFSAVLAMGSPVPVGSDAREALLRMNLFVPTFILPFLAGALGPVFFLREAEHDMREIVGSYPLTVRDWLVMRLGSFIVLLLTACLLAQIVFIGLLAPDHPGGLSTMVLHSAGWLLLLHAPTCLLWSCVLARLSSTTGHAGFLYLAAGIGWLAYMAVASVTGTPLIAGSMVISLPLQQAMLVFDPYGVTALSSPVPEGGILQSRGLNIAAGRLFWLLVCVWLVRGIGDLPSRAGRKSQIGGPATARSGKTDSMPSRRLSGRLEHLRLHLRYFRRDRVFPLLIGAWFLLLGPEAYSGIDYAEPLARIVPDSRDALNRVMWDVLPMAAAFLLLYAADRICRMYGALGMQELVAASPYRSWALVMHQVASLWIISAVFLALAGFAVLLAQIVAQSPFQPTEYLLQLGLTFSQMALFCVLFTAVHAIVKLRFVANLLNFLLVVLSFSSLAPALGFGHPLWRPLATPLMQPDHYWGFEGSLAGYMPYLLFWAAMCLAALSIGIFAFHRNMAFAQVRWRSIMRSPLLVIFAVLIGAAIWQGKTIHNNLRSEGLLVSAEQRAAQRAGYERIYSVWAQKPQPAVAMVRSLVDIYPDENRVHLRTTIQLVNRTAQPIEQVLIGRGPSVGPATLSFEGASVLHADQALGQQIFKLDRPMQPGESANLRFEIQLDQSGFAPASMPLVLRPSFSSVPAYAILPVVGFRRELTLRDPAARRSQGLPELRLTLPSLLRQTPAAGSVADNEAVIETIISTKRAHSAIAQGELIRKWQQGGRDFYHYRTSGPIRNMAAFYSVPWQSRQWQVGSTGLQVYAPGKFGNNNPNILGASDTLAWLDKEVAPYPGKDLRMIMVPELGISGFALPQTILISDRLGMRTQPEPGAGFNQTYRRAAHETAHQWFGHMIGHGLAEERGFLIESLAKYAELVMVEQRYGEDAMQSVVTFERDRYRQSRLNLENQVAPLIDAEEDEDMYSRATLVFACLRKHLGDEPILAALRQIADESRKTGRAATSLGFIKAFKTSSEPGDAELIEAMLLGSQSVNAVFKWQGCRPVG